MSNLVAIAYPDVDTAQEVMGTLGRLQVEKSIQLEDAVIVAREQDGKVKLHQARSTTGAGAAGGALWGGLIGLLFLVPLLGMAVGAASGALTGKLTDVGVDDSFLKELGEKLEPGMARSSCSSTSSTPDKVVPAIQQYGGHVIQSSLDNEAEARLQEALQGQGTAADRAGAASAARRRVRDAPLARAHPAGDAVRAEDGAAAVVGRPRAHPPLPRAGRQAGDGNLVRLIASVLLGANWKPAVEDIFNSGTRIQEARARSSCRPWCSCRALGDRLPPLARPSGSCGGAMSSDSARESSTG